VTATRVAAPAVRAGRIGDDRFRPAVAPTGEYMLRFRYLQRGPDGDFEEPVELFRRVAVNLATAERVLRPRIPQAEEALWAERFFKLMTDFEFLPNAPTLLGAGTSLQQLHACFVLPVGDSIEEIFDALRMAAVVHSNGGGTGFSFSALRPRGAPIATGGRSTGAVSFLRIFDSETEVIKQGGTGWGANMAVLGAQHPDVREFAAAKAGGDALRNFNLSVAVDDAFMKRAAAGERQADGLLQFLSDQALASGDPGLLFADRIERDNPTPTLGRLEATNPCGEAPLLPFEACCLGGLNVARFHDPQAAGGIDWARLRAAARLALRMMDNVIEVSRYPLPQIDHATRRTRKIGIGVMGFADLLVDLALPYDSPEAEQLALALMAEVSHATHEASCDLGEERGSFPAFERSVWAERGVKALRNATTTSNAPNSTIGAIAGCSAGIEPLFALSYAKHLASGEVLTELHPAFLEAAQAGAFASPELLAYVRAHGRVAGRPDVPLEAQARLRTAHEVEPEWHVRVQAAFQRHTDLGISKTINLAAEAGPADVRRAWELAWELGCKGVTVFRDGCLGRQFLATGTPAAEDCPVCL
jgi:ribonucleoside-diphosphate reductase alpha chain